MKGEETEKAGPTEGLEEVFSDLGADSGSEVDDQVHPPAKHGLDQPLPSKSDIHFLSPKSAEREARETSSLVEFMLETAVFKLETKLDAGSLVSGYLFFHGNYLGMDFSRTELLPNPLQPFLRMRFWTIAASELSLCQCPPNTPARTRTVKTGRAPSTGSPSDERAVCIQKPSGWKPTGGDRLGNQKFRLAGSSLLNLGLVSCWFHAELMQEAAPELVNLTVQSQSPFQALRLRSVFWRQMSQSFRHMYMERNGKRHATDEVSASRSISEKRLSTRSGVPLPTRRRSLSSEGLPTNPLVSPDLCPYPMEQ